MVWKVETWGPTTWNGYLAYRRYRVCPKMKRVLGVDHYVCPHPLYHRPSILLSSSTICSLPCCSSSL